MAQPLISPARTARLSHTRIVLAELSRIRDGSASERRAVQPEPARKVPLHRQLTLELRLQLELLGVVALALARRDKRPERALLVAVDPVDRILCAVELERGREQLRPEAAV